ncbi:MAG: tetratricopeptide repeat protein [Muribaculaceae bacterium]|nr:tetratricopeptide repeat protein [Muribaculaceae bacterium]
MIIGRNALYFDDYLLAIQYFNQAIRAKPYLAEPYLYRGIAKLQLEDYLGAEEDCSLALERNPFIVDAYQVRGVARQTMNKNELAIEDYDKGLEFMPEDRFFLINKAIAHESLKQYSKSDSTYATLVRLYPKFPNAYLGRAQLHLALSDTVSAIADIDKCLTLKKNNVNAYVMRSDIYARYNKDFKLALSDMDEAIRLQPQNSSYFVNRAYLKYNLDDYYGAIADYDYALDLNGDDAVAHFNRGLLLAQVQDDDKAIKDFTFVISRDPSNIMALYNRAELYARTGAYRNAIADYDKVIDKVSDIPGLYFARSESKRNIGDMAGGESDYNISRKMYDDMLKGKRKTTQITENNNEESSNGDYGDNAVSKADPDEVIAKFRQLLTVDADHEVVPEYDGKTRGRIQDNNYRIDAEPQYMLSYYQVINSLQNTSNFMREVNNLNEASVLPFELIIANSMPTLLDSQIERHFASIDYYNSLISTSEPRAVDYFARAIDFMMVKNYEAAIADLNKALELSPKFLLAYFARANVRYQKSIMESQINRVYPLTAHNSDVKSKIFQTQPFGESDITPVNQRADFDGVISDYNKVLELSPRNMYAYYNMGCIYLEMQEFTEALKAFSTAIEIRPDFGQAYYNRGLVYLRLGNRDSGVNDLSKAGELGIMPSYSVLKRMLR